MRQQVGWNPSQRLADMGFRVVGYHDDRHPLGVDDVEAGRLL